MSEAVKYAGLVGKYVSMERRATAEEIEAGHPETIGMAGWVAGVEDVWLSNHWGVSVLVDYGYAYAISPDEHWKFVISAQEPRTGQ